MDQERAVAQEIDPSPVFAAYRRGYDPEQVDRYIADQRRRLDETAERASEAERRLAAAVGQLRELHRRVAMLENEERSQTPPLDMLGERVQRILQESWEGAFQLRQAAEHDVAEQRAQTERECAEMLEAARRTAREERAEAEREVGELLESGQRRALLMRAETERRRQAYLEQVQDDREQAVGQISYLYEQRQSAVAELARLQANLEATVHEMARSPIGVPTIGSGAARHRASDVSRSPATLPDDRLVDVHLPPPRSGVDTPGLADDNSHESIMAGLDRTMTRIERPAELGSAFGAQAEASPERAITAEHEVLPQPERVSLAEPVGRSHARRRSASAESPSRRRSAPAPADPEESPSVFDFEDDGS